MPSLARCIALSLLFAAAGAHAAPWTYRGTLNDGGASANGRYDIRLSVLDAAGAKALGYPLTFTGVEVIDGAFAVDVDFGIDLSQFGAVKLKTEVAQGGSGFVALGEPQAFDAKAALVGVCWDTQGNAGTNPATDFLGTIDAQPMRIRSNNVEVAQIGSSSSASFGKTTEVALSSAATRTGLGSIAMGGAEFYPNSPSAGFNVALGDFSVVVGGARNKTGEPFSFVAGGRNNGAAGNGSFASGGVANCAGGDFSWAGGRNAIVRYDGTGNWLNSDGCGSAGTSQDANGDEGTFVWADAQGVPFSSTGPNQFLVRAEGGVGINGTPATAGLELNVFGATPFDGFVEFGLIPKPSLNGNTGERVEIGVGKGGAGSNDADLRIAHRNDSGGFFEHVSIDGDGSVIVRSNPANTAQGVQLAIGAGAWSSLSDRNLKTDIQSIEPLQLLERLVAMPIQQWRYIGQPGEVLHIGPMAQDFAAAFGVGENDTTISTVDADGVALAAIQGLNQKLEAELAQSRSENAGLQAQLQQLAARLAALEAAGEH